MDQMGEPFGVKWLTTTVDDSEPKHKFKFQRPGQPEEEATSFHTFYPKAQQ